MLAASASKLKPAASRNGKLPAKKPALKMLTTAEKQRNPRIIREIQMANAVRNLHHDLATDGNSQQNGQRQKDRVILLVRDAYWGPGQRLLDFGCGMGVGGVLFARLGYRVEGFDISPGLNCR